MSTRSLSLRPLLPDWVHARRRPQARAERLGPPHWRDRGCRGVCARRHLRVMLPGGVSELGLGTAAYQRGVLVEDGAWHWARPGQAPPSIVLGYGSTSEPTIWRGIEILAEALQTIR